MVKGKKFPFCKWSTRKSQLLILSFTDQLKIKLGTQVGNLNTVLVLVVGKSLNKLYIQMPVGLLGRGCWMLKLQIDQNKRTRTNKNFMLTIAPFQICMKARLYAHRIRGFIFLCTCSQPTSGLHLPVHRATQCYGNLDSTWRLHHGEWLSAVCSSVTKWSDIL